MCDRLSLMRHFLILSLCFGLTACGAAKPHKQEITAGLQKQIQSRQEAIKKQPKRAKEEVTMMIESLDSYEKQYGEPFGKIREKAVAMKSAWGDKTDLATMKKDFDTFVEEVSKL